MVGVARNRSCTIFCILLTTLKLILSGGSINVRTAPEVTVIEPTKKPAFTCAGVGIDARIRIIAEPSFGNSREPHLFPLPRIDAHFGGSINRLAMETP